MPGQEGQVMACGFGGLFDHRHVADILEHHQLAVADALVLHRGAGHIEQPVMAPAHA